MVGRWISFWDPLFSGSMWNFQGVYLTKNQTHLGQLYRTFRSFGPNQKPPETKIRSEMDPFVLLVGFNPFETYLSNWIISPRDRGENKKIFELPPPRFVIIPVPWSNFHTPKCAPERGGHRFFRDQLPHRLAMHFATHQPRAGCSVGSYGVCRFITWNNPKQYRETLHHQGDLLPVNLYRVDFLM